MEDKYEKIENFLDRLQDLVDGKFITADTGISEALRALSESRELTNLFTAITQGFDYPAAKKNYLRFPAEAGSAHGQAYLPTDRSEILAFVFCLFVEFDAGRMQLNDFLLRYFYVDGSYTASYAVFAERVVRPFRDIVRDCFPDLGKRGALNRIRMEQEEQLGKLARLLPVERVRLEKCLMDEDERVAADVLLSAIIAAAGKNDVDELTALLTGYKYFLTFNGIWDDNSREIFKLAAKL